MTQQQSILMSSLAVSGRLPKCTIWPPLYSRISVSWIQLQCQYAEHEIGLMEK